MTTRYSVVQYLPDPLSEERVNIGVVVFDAEEVRASFVPSWTRIAKFANEDVRYLKAFAADFQQRTHSLSPLSRTSGLDIAPVEFIELAKTWIHSIQFTPPRASLQSLDALIAEVEARFLTSVSREPVASYRDARDARSLVQRGVRKAVSQVLQNDTLALRLIHERKQLDGKLSRHSFDSVVENGKPYFAVQSISFEMPDASQVRKTVDATAFNIDDVRTLNPRIPIGVLALVPKLGQAHAGKARDAYDRAQVVFHGLGAQMFDESGAQPWAESTARATMPIDALIAEAATQSAF